MMPPMIISVRAVLSEVFGARFICFAVFTTVFSALLREVTFAFGLVDVRIPPFGALVFFGLSESLESSAIKPSGHQIINSAAIRIQPPISTLSFFLDAPPSSKRNEPVSGSYSKSLLIYLFSFFLPALAARSRSKSTIFVFLPVFSSST